VQEAELVAFPSQALLLTEWGVLRSPRIATLAVFILPPLPLSALHLSREVVLNAELVD
jgi:hypothetical protein